MSELETFISISVAYPLGFRMSRSASWLRCIPVEMLGMMMFMRWSK